MNTIHLLPVGNVDSLLLEHLREELPRSLRVDCEILPYRLDPSPAYHAERQQFHSSELLQKMMQLLRAGDWRFLAITELDLYIPILKYVFGEAQLGGPCAVVSSFRLRQEFYGLDRDEGLLKDRLLKESVHELGHTLGLHHCEDYRCAMASSYAVEWIDLRERSWCEECHGKVRAELGREEIHRAI
ncbi:MAG TPA: archaemetzincin [Candidatus Eisenbacteria bacterium]|nr:archaemetzincin [Candidatus Eisenbacteria bacterium]